LNAPEVTAAVVAELDYGPDAAAGTATRVRATLIYLAKHGSVVKEGEREAAKWALAEGEAPRFCGIM
jgi:hypothetical protein